MNILSGLWNPQHYTRTEAGLSGNPCEAAVPKLHCGLCAVHLWTSDSEVAVDWTGPDDVLSLQFSLCFSISVDE